MIDFILTTLSGMLSKIMGDKIEKASKPIADKLFQKDCPKCKGKGKIKCEDCDGKGAKKQKKVSKGKCSICSGTGKILVACPSCFGTGNLHRSLKFDTLNATQQVRKGFLWIKPSETVTVQLRNIDNVDGKFICYATVGNQSKSIEKVIPAGKIDLFILEFELENSTGYQSNYNISPENITVPCSSCSGIGTTTRLCTTCSGSGEIDQTSEVELPCTSCKSLGYTECLDCKASGKISRITL